MQCMVLFPNWPFFFSHNKLLEIYPLLAYQYVVY